MGDWELVLGAYPGILIGARTYKNENTTDHVLYIPFFELCLTILSRLMGKTKQLLEQLLTQQGHLLDAEYLEWAQYAENAYAIQQDANEQASTNPIDSSDPRVVYTQDEFGVYSRREEDN